MNCEVVRQQIAEATVEELQKGFDKNIEEHLSACPDCRAYLEQIKNLAIVLDTEIVSTPESLELEVLGNLHKFTPKPFYAKRLLIAAIIFLLVSAIAVSYYITYVWSNPDPEDCDPHDDHNKRGSQVEELKTPKVE